MGIVYLARQKAIGRLVALKKIIDKSGGDEEILGITLARFRKEAEALGKIQHPNIIQVFDYGVGADSMPFFATEYCPGGALSDAIKNRRVDPRQAARLMVTMVRAMAVAHQAGIVHRDLKPHNVLLDRPCEEINSFDPNGLKIADFGLVRDTAKTDDARYTQENQAMGTWLYMAPEQMENAAGAGAPADTYSLGVILYEMVTGRLPLVAKNQREMIRLIEEVDPQPIQTFAPSCPKDLETICLKCLRKDPAKRYPSADAFADDLKAFLEYRTVSARPAGKVERTIKWIRRNPGPAVGAFSAALLAILVLVSTIAFSVMRIRQERDLRQKDNERAALEIEQVEKEAAIRQEAESRKVEAQAQERAAAIVANLLGNEVSPEAVSGLLERFDREKEYALPLLDKEIAGNKHGAGKGKALLAALPYRKQFLKSVEANSLSAHPGEIPAYAGRLSFAADRIAANFWNQMDAAGTPHPVRLRLASLLAIWSPNNTRWPMASEQITEALVGLDVLELNPWLTRILPIELQLLPHLEKVFKAARMPSPGQSSLARADSAARIIASLKSSDPHLLARCVIASNDSQFDILSSRIRTDSAEVCRLLDEFTCTDPATGALGNFLASIVPMEIGPDIAQTRKRISQRSEKCRDISRALCCLAFLGKPERLWEALERIDIPDLFSEIVHLAPSTKLPLSMLVNRLLVEKRHKTKRSIILMLGFYPPEDVMRAGGEKLVGILMDDCANTPDPGVHAAALWLLSWRLGRANEVAAALDHVKTTQDPANNRLSWRINGQGQRLAGVPSGWEFMMGSGPDDPDKVIQLGHDIEKAHKVMIGHAFEIGLQEVTVAQYRKFKKDYRPFDSTDSDKSTDPGLLPATGISWFDAMDYCKWLSEQEKTKPEQVIMQSVDIRPNCRLEADFTGKTGYRLPTEEEWELVSRAGYATPYSSGYSPRRLNDYAWTWENSGGNAKPSGKLLPNPWGISDASGNALEWVMDDFKLYKSDLEISKTSAGLPFFVIPGDSLRIVRGGSFSNAPEAARFSSRLMSRADQRASSIGFRVCRTTIPANPKPK
ncbi:MAG: bifunctional serine/threonine-protein kinase/formylglycine-generating enzyme family protein [Planctomycetota bacterium]